MPGSGCPKWYGRSGRPRPRAVAVGGTRVQKLHLVGITTDHRGLIFSARRGAKSGGFVVSLDGELLALVEAAQQQLEADAATTAQPGPLEQPPARPESTLTVREV